MLMKNWQNEYNAHHGTNIVFWTLIYWNELNWTLWMDSHFAKAEYVFHLALIQDSKNSIFKNMQYENSLFLVYIECENIMAAFLWPISRPTHATNNDYCLDDTNIRQSDKFIWLNGLNKNESILSHSLAHKHTNTQKLTNNIWKLCWQRFQ